MSENNPIRIFVTHTFSDHADYARAFEYLESSSNFYYKNCSAPNRVPAPGGKEALKKELRTQIQDAEIVLLPTSMYTDASDWIQYQMIAAQEMNIPIAALEIFGGTGEVQPEIAKRVSGTVGWNERLIVDAVYQHDARRGYDAV
jgi:hypothetical protein